MTNWQETSEIVARLGQLATGERAALATVVAIDGSAYRRPGAKLLVTGAGESLGGVSGGCLESDVREIARDVLASGQPQLRRYDTGSGHEELIWGLGLGCEGRVDVFVQPATSGPFAGIRPALAGLLRGDAPFTLVTRIPRTARPTEEGTGAMLLVAGALSSGTLGSAELDRRARAEALALVATGRSTVRSLGEADLFYEGMTPPVQLLVCGAGDDAQALVELAATAGLRITVADHRPALVTAARFPAAARLMIARPDDADIALPDAARSLAVVKMHSYAHDRDWARRLLAEGVPFVGLLGPRARSARIRSEIGAASDERLVGPVGLDLGAEGPRQIAISIVAQLLAVLADRTARPLAGRSEPIHAG